jgi:hypothetical protein
MLTPQEIVKRGIVLALVTAAWATSSYASGTASHDLSLTYHHPFLPGGKPGDHCTIETNTVEGELLQLLPDTVKSTFAPIRVVNVSVSAFGMKEHYISLKDGQLSNLRYSDQDPITVKRLFANPVKTIHSAEGGFAHGNHGLSIDVNDLSEIVRWGHNSQHHRIVANKINFDFYPELVVDPEDLAISDGNTYAAVFLITCLGF